MKDEYVFTISVTICALAFFAFMGIAIVNSHNNYTKMFEQCLAAQHTWIPTGNSGVCLAPTVTIDNNLNPQSNGMPL